MKKNMKKGLLTLLKWTGGFHLCRAFFKKRLRILCYHGFAFRDEHLLDDILFMQPETFKRRLELIKKWRMNVVSLDSAVKALSKNKNPDHALVITFDDGWHSTLLAASVLKDFGFPSTVYVSTYYVQKQNSVFNVIMRYLFYKAGRTGDPQCQELLEQGASLDLATHEKLIRETALRLGVELASIEAQRMFHFMNEKELRTLRKSEMNIELHTHRHLFPLDHELAMAEIRDNREALESIDSGPYQHFCFPSGIFQDSQLPWLAAAGIKSATTTLPGFNSAQSPVLKLNRHLDRDKQSDIEFEAEICGVTELFRKCFRVRQ